MASLAALAAFWGPWLFASSCIAVASGDGLLDRRVAKKHAHSTGIPEFGDDLQLPWSGVAAFFESMAGLDSNPIVSAGTAAAIDSMVASIDANIEREVTFAHRDSQRAVQDVVAKLREATTLLVHMHTKGVASDTAWVACVGKEKELAQELGLLENQTDGMKSEQNTACDVRTQVRAILGAEERALDTDGTTVQNANHWWGVQDAKINEAHLTFERLKQACRTKRDEFEDHILSVSNKRVSFMSQRRLCMDLATQKQLDRCEFDDLYVLKCSTLEEYKALIVDLNAKKTGIHSEAALKSQWEAAETMKCFLKRLQDGEPASMPTLTTCRSGVNYGADVGSVDTLAAQVDILTSGTNFTCNENSIAFNGTTWTIRPSPTPSAEDYVKDHTFRVPVLPVPRKTAFSSCAPSVGPTCDSLTCPYGMEELATNEPCVSDAHCAVTECCSAAGLRERAQAIEDQEASQGT